MTLEQVKNEHILKVLLENNSHMTKTAKALDVSVRHLRRKVREFEIAGILEPMDRSLKNYLVCRYCKQSCSRVDLNSTKEILGHWRCVHCGRKW